MINKIYSYVPFLAGICVMIFLVNCGQIKNTDTPTGIKEKYRPAFHFTPDSMWMNDPNGMVYYAGEYHLFYQYYPDSTVWGPMHWGHAVSTDMIHWEHLPIALYPDTLGYIFSGSAVIDWKNTSGFGEDGKIPMVAIFTHHNMAGEKAGTNNFQYQSIAYSLDKGRTWTKYQGNPVIPNTENIKDFRDPKVIWHNETQKWVMVLAAKDKAMFYTSPDLKTWTYESSYGIQNDNRLWECPDLFPLKTEGSDETKWILVVSMQSGAPNGGTGTSYFVGDFDGKTFTNNQANDKQYWLDYGTDNYAMVSWSDIPDTDGRRLMMGWMSNWLYAQKVPTERWRSAMTLPREVILVKAQDGEWKLSSRLVSEYQALRSDIAKIDLTNIKTYPYPMPEIEEGLFEANISFLATQEICLTLTNGQNDSLKIGYKPKDKTWFIDRTKAGISDFYDGFAARHITPCSSVDDTLHVQLIFDKTSVELFANKGYTSMTDIYFPKETLTFPILEMNTGHKPISFTLHNLSAKK
ncbi:MAG TPA: glycoside hydrolase family 32 protein [Saprospiraceae bacterium]|nr:glycoside hydrolase family 32 protein [Saprospiraceae bacterium]